MPAKEERHSIWGRVYGAFYSYRELYENVFEVIVGTFEIFLIAFGLGLAAHEFLDDSHRMGGFEEAHIIGELFIFALLSLLTLSRLVVVARTRRLGYTYRIPVGELERPDADTRRQFFAAVAQVPLGHPPCLSNDWTEQLPYLSEKIAHQTASLLSIRSWFLQDDQWRSREQEALGDWFTAFPASLWHIADGTASPPGPTGYYSVTVPMTAKSARSIRRGQRATDMAEVEPAVVKAFSFSPLPEATGPRRVDLIAYLHIHVPEGDEPRDDTVLLASSFQHLAFLLLGLFGCGDGFEQRWTFTVLCESSNHEMNMVLQSIGFVQLKRERDGSKAQTLEARSYAGFMLFELKVDNGQCEEGDARALLELLRQLVIRLAKRGQADA